MKCSQWVLAFCLTMVTSQLLFPPASCGQVHSMIDPDIPFYVSQMSVTGNLTISAPDTVKPLVERWAKDLIRQHPDLTVTVIREGSKTGLVALFERRVEVTAMSRRMTPSELTDFILEFGYEPMEVPVARHASAVIVQNDNLDVEAFRTQFVEAPGVATPLSTVSIMDDRYANSLVPSKVDRFHHFPRTHYLYITRPSRSNPTRASVELVRYALSRQGQELVLDLGHSPLSFAEIARVRSKWLTCCDAP